MEQVTSMTLPKVQCKIDFEEIDEADFLDAFKSCKIIQPGFNITKIHLNPPGEGVENLNNWALREIFEAMSFDEGGLKDDSKRKSTNAVITARRSLSCLVDWYMQRDGFSYCHDFNKSSESKSEILLKTGIIDKLTSRVLTRLINIRNTAEHEYEAIDLNESEDIVELLRRTYDSLRNISNPSHMPVVIGCFPYGFSFGGNSYEFGFGGWTHECLVLHFIDPDPWIGVVIPVTKEYAIVRRTFLKKMHVDMMIQIQNCIYSSLNDYSKNWKALTRNDAMPKYFYIEIGKLAGLL